MLYAKYLKNKLQNFMFPFFNIHTIKLIPFTFMYVIFYTKLYPCSGIIHHIYIGLKIYIYYYATKMHNSNFHIIQILKTKKEKMKRVKFNNNSGVIKVDGKVLHIFKPLPHGAC